MKLWQFEPKDRQHVNTLARADNELAAQMFLPPVKGCQSKVLYYDEYENVSVYELAPQATLNLNVEEGFEVMVLDGEFIQGADILAQHSWLRLPIGCPLNGQAGRCGARLWIKSQHLPYVKEQIARLNNA